MRREISFLIAMAVLMKKKLIPQSCQNVNLQEDCSEVYLDLRCWLNGSPYSLKASIHSGSVVTPGQVSGHYMTQGPQRREGSWRLLGGLQTSLGGV